MIILGLTGSIGMGKSTAANMLQYLGVSVHDADREVHDLLSSNGAAMPHVARAFPESWDKKKRIINRQILGRIVFADPEKRALLEEIVHPFVRQAENKFLKNSKRLGQNIVALDIPLLFETRAEGRMDYTIVVTAPFFIQAQRVLARPNMDEEKFYAILEHQMPDKEKRMRADFVVQTGQGRHNMLQQLKQIIRRVK